MRVELQRPFLRDDRARNRRLARLAQQLGLRCVATGNVHAHQRSRAPLQDALVAIRLHSTLDASEPERRGNFSHVLASPEAMAARFPEYPEAVAETERLAEMLRFDLTSDLGYRYPGAEDETALATLHGLCQARLHERYAQGRRWCGCRAADRGAADHREARPGRLLPAPPRPARARPRGRGGGARSRHGAGAAAAWARPRLERVLDRLLPDRALARGSDRQRAADRALSQRGADLAARHRPRLPARHPRAADPARARALRARSLRAGGRLSHLPRQGGDPRARQGARAAAGGDRARGARQ